MTPREQYELLRRALTLGGHDPYGYSGRCMYGRQCLAVNDVSEWDAALLVAEEVSEEWTAADLIEAIGAPSSDSMGRGFVIYWPNIPWLADSEGD